MTEDVPDILDVADRYRDEDKLRRIGHGPCQHCGGIPVDQYGIPCCDKQEERAAIVAWLRANQSHYRELNLLSQAWGNIADAIERGEYEGASDE